jgi:hypothetical protein
MEGPLDFKDCRSGVCFVHNTEPMLMTQFATVRLQDGSDYNAFACSVPDCHVHFSPLRGYEEVREGEYRQLVLNPLNHPKCKEHDLYMMVMMPSTDGVHEWACPVKSCNSTHSSRR